MDTKTKKKLARISSALIFAFLYILGTVVIVNSAFNDYNLSDRGIILEITGFVLFLGPIRTKLAQFQSYVNDDIPDTEFFKRNWLIVAIIVILIGLIFQLSFIPDF